VCLLVRKKTLVGVRQASEVETDRGEGIIDIYLYINLA